MAPSHGCALQEAMEEEEEEKKPFDGCQQNKRHHRRREATVWAALRRVARLRPVDESGRRGAEPWTQGQAR